MSIGTNTAMRGAAIVVGFALLSPISALGQARCDFTEVVELNAASRDDVVIRAGSGSLDVEGSDRVTEVLVSATFCASDEDRLEALGVTAEASRSSVLIETEYPESRGWGGDTYARIDLVVTVPTGTALDIEDGSGSMELLRVGDIRVKDGSGEIVVRGAGAIVIEDGSGGLDIRDASGNVEVSDGSGRMEVRSVDGDVLLDDGSGGIEVEAVTGTVRVESMGSGAVRIDDVGGDLIVEDGRRERIKYSNVRGELDLPPARKRRRGN